MTNTPTVPTVVVLDAYDVLHGAQRCLLELFRLWREQGRFHLHFLHLSEGALTESVRAMGIPSTLLPAGSLLGSYNKRLLQLRARDYGPLAIQMARFGWRVRRVLHRVGADLFHCNTDRAALMSLAAAPWKGCPMVTHIRRDTSFERLDRMTYRASTEMIWVSRRVRDEFARANGIAAPKGRVIYDGRALPDAAAPPTSAELCREFDLPPDAILALKVASFDSRKDHETVVGAAAIACAAEPRLYFLLAGDDVDPNKTRLRHVQGLVAEAQLLNRVLFLGHRTDVSRLLRGSLVLVNTAREEALGGALIEAIGHGVPCVATDTGGTGEIVPDGRCGFLVPRGDAAGVAERILRMVNDPGLRERFSVHARAHFLENFTSEQSAEQTAVFFEEIIRCRRNRVHVSGGPGSAPRGDG